MLTRQGWIGLALIVGFVATVLGGLQLLVIGPAQKRAKAISCSSLVVRILFASRACGREHGAAYETNILCLSNQLLSPVWIVCPLDERRHELRRQWSKGPQDWATLTTDNYSYEVFLR